jgi:hypothetical protein
MESYLERLDVDLFKSADVLKRGNYYFVDVKYKDKTKETNFRFENESEAEEFLYLIYGMYYRNNDKTNFTGIDIFAAIVITFFITFILSSVI